MATATPRPMGAPSKDCPPGDAAACLTHPNQRDARAKSCSSPLDTMSLTFRVRRPSHCLEVNAPRRQDAPREGTCFYIPRENPADHTIREQRRTFAGCCAEASGAGGGGGAGAGCSLEAASAARAACRAACAALLPSAPAAGASEDSGWAAWKEVGLRLAAAVAIAACAADDDVDLPRPRCDFGGTAAGLSADDAAAPLPDTLLPDAWSDAVPSAALPPEDLWLGVAMAAAAAAAAEAAEACAERKIDCHHSRSSIQRHAHNTASMWAGIAKQAASRQARRAGLTDIHKRVATMRRPLISVVLLGSCESCAEALEASGRMPPACWP